ncbi:hypothetical protein L0222_00580 [bacterium]|nr:hypothetical protein [bacterium]MCI0603242.1 hypothetical protein [bacterium]
MKVVIFYTKNGEQEVEVGRVWNEGGQLQGTVNEIFLNDLKDWLMKSGEEVEDYLQDLHKRFDGTFLYAGPYREATD